ncbi:MAG: hypothetical protein KKD97_16410 [Gammaproteobacteria bacterium]|nr:hypothetical protein [Gammaproteobacteria bacterium]
MSDELPKRRGRPPKEGAKPTSAERSKKSEDALKQRGGLRTSVNFTPEGNQAAQALMEAHGYSDRSETVNETLIKAAAKIKR